MSGEGSQADIAALFGLTPEAAIRYLESRKLALSFDAGDLAAEAHARAFTLAKITQMDVLKDVHDGLLTALREGLSERDFLDRLIPVLKTKGWWGKREVVNPQTGEVKETVMNPHRLKTIYRTNLQQAYAAGLHQELMKATASHPYWQYVAILDSRTRDSHRMHHGKVYHHDAEFWKTWTPPNGLNCRCTLRPLRESKVKREGLSVGDPNEVPRPPDSGFAVNYGQTHLAHLGGLLLEKAVTVPPAIAAQAIQAALGQPRQLAALTADFAAWADGVERPKGELRNVGALSPVVLRALAARQVTPDSAVIAVRDADVLHTHRDTKPGRIPWEWYRELPKHVLAPQAVLRQLRAETPTLLLVYPGSSEHLKLVVKLDYVVKQRRKDGKLERSLVNIVRTGSSVPTQDLLNRSHFEVLDGEM